jgi:tripartite-type tricarboxylate transporter receptor subunit TctC
MLDFQHKANRETSVTHKGKRLQATPACAVIAALWLSASSSVAQAQAYPAKAVRIIVAYAPGGGTDVMARLFAPKFSEAFGQPFVVENRPGFGGNIGTELVAKAPPDGYTLLMTTAAHAINVSLYAKVGYDPVRDFAPVTLVSAAPNMLSSHPSLPVKTLKEFVALAKAQPGAVSYASPGGGTPQHLAMELFRHMAGIQVTHIPYNGGGPSVIAARGGQVPVLASSLPTALPHAKAGKLRPLAVTSAQRSQLAPDYPTVDEAAGLKGYEANVWFGLFAPAGTPPAVINRLNAEVEKLEQQQDIRDRLTSLGFDPVRNTPDQFSQLLKADVAKWGKVVRDSGAKPD